MIVLEIRAQLIYKEFKFNEQLNNDRIADIVEFCKKSGILNLFSEINDLYAYLLGMEVGLDSNARKNRSGKIFEDLVGLLLKIKLSDHQGFTLKKEDSSINIEGKRFDYAIYYNKNPKYVLECNFYATTGSKPSEVARSYRGLHTQCKDENLLLIWVTDGPAWHKMKNIIHENFKKIDYPMNYTILNEKIDSILNNLKK
jgi:type II restriction enzyme